MRPQKELLRLDVLDEESLLEWCLDLGIDLPAYATHAHGMRAAIERHMAAHPGILTAAQTALRSEVGSDRAKKSRENADLEIRISEFIEGTPAFRAERNQILSDYQQAREESAWGRMNMAGEDGRTSSPERDRDLEVMQAQLFSLRARAQKMMNR